MKSTHTYNVIGLMSGTSLDGLDIAYCQFKEDMGNWSFDIIHTNSVPYDTSFRQKLKNAVHLDAMSLLTFHNQYGTWLGQQVHHFIRLHHLHIDFIASHGHTVHHQPEIGVTYQIGSGQHLANTCNHRVICDFRTNDVALHGQGAPLVPIGDQLLYHSYDFCLNLGGISNVSFQQQEKRIAYDISPVNMLLNFICNKINIAYDKGGQLAATGTLNTALLQQLDALPYYTQQFPKSLGYEWFAAHIIPILERTNDTIENLLHTAVFHIAEQIAVAIQKAGKKKSKVFVTGGGAKNDFLLKILHQKLNKNTTLVIPNEEQIDYKEAVIFAFMGVLKTRNEVNCLSSVTGAIRDSSSGVIYDPM